MAFSLLLLLRNFGLIIICKEQKERRGEEVEWSEHHVLVYCTFGSSKVAAETQMIQIGRMIMMKSLMLFTAYYNSTNVNSSIKFDRSNTNV